MLSGAGNASEERTEGHNKAEQYSNVEDTSMETSQMAS